MCSHVKLNRADISMSANGSLRRSKICLHVDDALNEGQLLFCVVVILFGIFRDLAN